MTKKEQINRLVHKAAQGNKRAFAALCETIGRDILYICISILGNREDGEDAAQEVLLVLQKKITTLRDPQSFELWKNKIIHSVCSNLRRGQGKQGGVLSIDDYAEELPENPALLPELQVETQEGETALLDAINELPEYYRTVVMMHYYENLSHKEIAEVLGKSENAVEHSLRRARSTLRKQMREKKDVSYFALLGGATQGAMLRSALHKGAQAGVKPAQVSQLLKASGVKALPSLTVVVKSGLAAVAAVLAITVATYALPAWQQERVAPPLLSLPPVEEEKGQYAPGVASEAPADSQEDKEQSDPEPKENPGGGASRNTSRGDSPDTKETVDTGGRPGPESTSPVSENRPAREQYLVRGKVLLLNQLGEPVESLVTQGAAAYLYAGEQVVGVTRVDLEGRYEFAAELLPEAAGRVEVRLISQAGGETGYKAASDSFAFAAHGGEMDITPILVCDSIPPSAVVSLQNGKGEQTLVSPVKAEILVSDLTDVKVEWKIQELKSGVLVVEGTQTELKEELLVLKGTKKTYKLIVLVSDLAGNQAKVEKEFYMR